LILLHRNHVIESFFIDVEELKAGRARGSTDWSATANAAVATHQQSGRYDECQTRDRVPST